MTQTRVALGKDEEFARWQQEMSDAVAACPGFVDHAVLAPAPPSQLDWVIIQRFRSMEAAQAWLRSPERQRLLALIEPALVGRDDIHLVTAGQSPATDSFVSAVISTKVAPGREEEFRAWQRRIATTEATFAGFQGASVEPPIPHIQDDWATVVRFDSDQHLQAWLTSPERRQLLDQSAAFAESHVRTMRGGFDGWFDFGGRAAEASPPAWKQNMVVLLVLYPVVFLLGEWFEKPLLTDNGVPFWLALFITSALGVSLMGFYVAGRVMDALKWWLVPRADAPRWTNLAGTALVLALYGLFLAIFSRFP